MPRSKRTSSRDAKPRAHARSRTSPKPRTSPKLRNSAHPDLATPLSAADLGALRDIFWSNVVREMLTGLSMLSQQSPEILDGRFAVLTQGGERIPIAAIEPIFACSMTFNSRQRGLSEAVQATVFRLQTPAGEVFTLPLQEIRAIHALTPELIAKMQATLGEAGESEPGSTSAQPFGLAAFTALPRFAVPIPEHPTE